MPLISIVVPCYNEEAVLPQLYAELNRVSGLMDYVDFEYCFVDDGSSDTTVEILRGYAAADKRVRFSSFSRNFGKEAAMLAGLRMATGDYVAVMDADLQHPPEMLVEMYAAIKDGEYDCAAARRTDRGGNYGSDRGGNYGGDRGGNYGGGYGSRQSGGQSGRQPQQHSEPAPSAFSELDDGDDGELPF